MRRAALVTTPMLIAAAEALAQTVGDDEVDAAYIVPSVFHPHVAETVAEAVKKAAAAHAAATAS